MARQSKATVDYFPHNVGTSQSLKIIIKRYQQTGYMFWFKLLELLGETEYHFFDTLEEDKFEDFYTDCFIEKDLAFEILNKFAKLGMIDSDLWNEHIIFSQNFVDNIKDAYRKRNINPMDKSQITAALIQKGRIKKINGGINPQVSGINSAINPQSKVKYSKEDKSIVDYKKISPESQEINQIIDLYKKYFNKTYRLSFEEKTTICHINNQEEYTLEDWETIFKNASKGWMIKNEKVKPALSNILANYSKFLNDDYNLGSNEKTLEEKINDGYDF